MIKGKILVVDDEEGMRVTLKKILSNRGYSVTTAADFQEASYYLQKENYDTVVADIILYDINGLELLRVIKEKTPDLPTIIITGAPNIKTAIESVRLGAYDYLIKPITKYNLPPIVAKAIEKKKLIEEKRLLEKENIDIHQNFENKLGERTSELKKRNNQLKKFHNEIFQFSQKATAQFLAFYVSQKLYGSLRDINNSLLNLKPYAKERDCIQKNFQTIGKEIEAAQIITDSFLTFSQNWNIPLQKVNCNLLLENTLNGVYIPDTILIKKNRLKTLPLITANEERIYHIFINLVNNATQAMPEGGELTITTQKHKYYVEISFSDTGVGISKSDQKKIFQPFFTTRSPQNGLGLSVCKFLLQQHKGTISFQSTEGKGSTFSIQLPRETEKFE